MPDADRLASIHALLVRHFGYGELRPLQLRVVTALEEGRDVLAVLPTGAGKSLCFQLPAMLRRAATIVVSPLISLMQDQVAAATARGLPAAAINSTLPGSEPRRVLDRVAEGVGRLLYTSRERLRALFDALHLQDALALVYAPTRNLVEELSRVLQEAGFRAAAYHAGLTSTVRKQVLSRFLADELGIVVATSAFGMGIDKPNVRLVVHWTLPPTPEAYYQEAGRAGRDGALARCLLLYRPGDAEVPRRQLDVTFPKEELAERVWRGGLDPCRVPSSVRASVERLRGELRPEGGPVDWTPVRRRRREAEARIAVMEHYAKDGRCRRSTLLA